MVLYYRGLGTLITWRIWRILRYPLRQNEIFKWVWREFHNEPTPIEPQWNIPIRMLMMFLGISFGMVLIPVVMVIALLSLLTFPFLILMFNGTILGVRWVLSITNKVSYHLRGERSQLLNATPRGTLGLSWIMATVCVHRGDMLRTAYRLIRSVTGILVGLLVVGLIYIAAHLPNSPLRDNQIVLLVDLIGLLAFMIAAWLDHIQSIVLAVLIGIVAPTYRGERLLIRFTALSVYLTLQMIFYATVIGFLQIAQTTTAMLDNVILERLLVMSAALLLFYAFRELLIILCYRLLLLRYDVTANDFQEIIV
jgi:hypothetical protein